MGKERMSSSEIALRKEEYYELLATSERSLRDVLNQRGGLVLARVGRYQPWPARFSEPGEFVKMSRYRAKKGQACVYFFGSRNYGWVSKSTIQPFPEDASTLTSSNKYNVQLIQDAMDEAKLVWDVTDEMGVRFFDRIMEHKEDAVDMPCERCNRVDDHYSLLILCDGANCKREYHMNCLNPPLVTIPPGDWFCPDCEKDMAKRAKPESAGTPNAANASAASISNGPGSGSGSAASSGKHSSSAKKTKKDKHKTKDGTVKRRLPSTSPDPDRAGPAKKQRAQRSTSREVSPSRTKKDSSTPKAPGTGPQEGAAGGHKKPPHIEIPANRTQLLSDPDSSTTDEAPRSEEKCLVCGFGGELVVCEFQGCTKVYHQFCLGSYPFPKNEDATWFCPRHTCTLTGSKETCEDQDTLSIKGKHGSPRKVNVKNLLWKCNHCPLALADDALPQLTQGQIFSKKLRTFMCPYCYLNAPGKVQLGKMLEKIWSTLATNRQGMPFCGPMLCGVEPLGEQFGNERPGMDLYKVLAKIRRLEYDNSLEFSRDIDTVVAEAIEMIANRSYPLMEAAKTLKIIRNEQFAINQQKIHFLDNKIRRLKTDRHNDRDNEDLVGFDKNKWPLRWRQECGPFEDKYYADLEAKSLEEWTAYVSAAPLYASGDEFDNRNSSTAYMSDDVSENDGASQGFLNTVRGLSGAPQPATGAAGPASSPASITAAKETSPGLTLSEGTDVMIALGDLSKKSGDEQKRRFGGEQDRRLDNVDAREFFLSPSSSEMQHMFDQQSTLLRGALEAHSTLQRSWLISQQDILGLGGRNGFSVGEGRLAAELRLANKNLRQRLRNKDKLVDQLTSDHMTLRSEVISLQKELSQSKMYARELERKVHNESVSSVENQSIDPAEAYATSRDAIANGGGASTPDQAGHGTDPYKAHATY